VAWYGSSLEVGLVLIKKRPFQKSFVLEFVFDFFSQKIVFKALFTKAVTKQARRR